MPPPNLREIVDKIQSQASTKRLDMSLNEIADMYSSGELIINPLFQRNFVWENYQRSRFIESLLLDLPTPPFYFVETDAEDGTYELVDGLQRLSSYLHFRGELKNYEVNPKIELGSFLSLSDCEIIRELNGMKWNDLPPALIFRLKRAFISVQVIQKSSNPELKYHLFKRLNSGGARLSDHQIRNCTVRMLGGQFLDLIDTLARDENYIRCTEPLSSEDRRMQEDRGLVLRYFAFKNNPDGFVHDVNPFLDDYLEGVTRYLIDKRSELASWYPFDIESERAAFQKLFRVLARTTAERSFTYPKSDRSALTAGFSRYHFEGVVTGLSVHLNRLNPDDALQMSRLKERLEMVRLSEEFLRVSKGGGLNHKTPAEARKLLISQAVEAII